MTLPTRLLGRTGPEVTRLGYGAVQRGPLPADVCAEARRRLDEAANCA